MKIGVTCHPTYGGSGAVATELGLEMARAGHEVHFISYAQPFRLDGFREGVYFHEVEMEPYPLFENPPYSLALAVMIHDVAARHDLDLVHAHYAIPHATSAWIAREMFEGRDGPRLVTTLHGTDITLVGQHPSFKRITRFSILRSDGLTAVSSFLARETESSFGVDADTIRVIPNFIDTERYRPGREPCHRATLAPGGEKIVMHISNFRPVKRVEDVVEAFAGMVARTPARLVMVGDGPDRVRAQRAARRLGVEDQVVFPGKHAAVDELLSCADLFLLPSESESFGLAALEAMSCGVPVIATSVGGLPEVVVDGETGHLVEVGDTDAMARLGADLLADDDHRRQMGEAARARAVDTFSVPRVVPRYAEFYARVLAAPPENGTRPRPSPAGSGLPASPEEVVR